MIINIVLSATFTVVIYLLKRQVNDLGVIFNAWWCIVLIGFSLAKSSMYDVQSSVWWYIASGTLVFNIVYILSSLGKEVRFTFGNRKPRENWKIENEIYRVINYIQYAMFLMMIPLVIRTLPTLLSGSLLDVRMNYLGNGSAGPTLSTIERLVYIFFGVFPCVASCTMLHAILWSRGQVRFRSIWFDFVNIICIVLISGARTYVFYTAIYFIGAYILNSTSLKRTTNMVYRKLRRNIKWIILVIGIMGFIITAQRSFSGNKESIWDNLIDTLIIYFTGGIKVLDITLLSPGQYGLNDLTYGSTLIAGITSVMEYIFNALPIVGGIFTQFPTDIAQQYLTNNIWIGPRLAMNAFGTMYYYFMRDFGKVGMVIGPTILGLIASHVSRKKAIDYFSYILRMQLLLLIIFSVCWWEPFRMEYWVITIQALVWYRFAVKWSSKYRKSEEN